MNRNKSNDMVQDKAYSNYNYTKRTISFVYILLLMLTLGITTALGQSATLADGDGYYYIKNYNTNYFLKPAAAGSYSSTNPYYQNNTNTPFLSTNTTGEATGSLWILKRNGDYYQIIHAEDGKYVTTNGSVISNQTHRKRMHLENKDEANDDNDFVLATNGDYYNISHKTMTQGNHKYWNPSGGNQNYDDGGTNGYSGIVGLYNDANDNGSKWKFAFVKKCVTPEIRVSVDGVVTITSVTSGATIYYTTNGDTPTTSSTEYSDGFTLTGTTVKAIAVKTDYTDSDVAEATFAQTATPTFDQTNCDNTIAINCADAGATIIYTTDGSTPSKSNGALYMWPFTPATGATVKAAAYIEGEKILSSIASLSYSPAFTEAPTITVAGNTITITGSGTIYYTTDGSDPTVGNSGQEYGSPVTLPDGSGSTTIKAVAKDDGLEASCVVEKRIIVTISVYDVATLKAIRNNPGDSYMVTADFDASGLDVDITLEGVFDGDFHIISGLTRPLFSSVNGGTVKNVMLKGVNIDSNLENVGAITCIAEGYSCIYNCGILPNDATFPKGTHPSVSTSGSYAGSIVGSLKDDSRVVNCFSYADVSSDGTAAGIVGNNTFASDASETEGKYANLRTMVVNCMYYGNISASTIYPVYGGQKISNTGDNAINNYNFYSVGCTFSPSLTGYNCSWPAQLEYLTRYEFHRNLLNSNRELCGWWVGAPSAPSTMSTANVQAVPKDASLIAKWVLDPAVAPYPILKPFGKYVSPVNIDADASWRETANEWEGKKLGTLSVSANPGSHFSASNVSLTLTITDMDTLRTDYCYRKVQLPYYNSVFGNPNGTTWVQKYGNNYGDYVVIGWKVSTDEGTMGTLTEDWQDGYNFADRNCTAKDANRVFAQGGYYYVPEGVTSITITAQWAEAIYFDNTDHSYDRVYMSGSKSGTHFAPAGTRPTTLGNGKTVSTNNLRDLAIASTGDVFNRAVVLVGNHQYRHSDGTNGENIGNTTNTTGYGFTVMSSDFDLDEEPDHCLIWQLGQKYGRQSFCPIRFDFLPIEEIGLAMKEDGSTQYYALGCYRPLGHFEVTETSLIHFGQFEFSNKNRTIYAPLILNGGIYDQYTKGTNNNAFSTADDKINYIIIGGNVRMPSFTPGAHVNGNSSFPTRHCAVNVIGGSIDNLYLTGNFNENVTPNVDNPHCYIDGGRIKQVAAAGREGINGDVYFKINHSKIWEFYGGSTMDLATGNNFKIVKGNIDVTINNSIVDKYCGGPKFGNMIYDEDTPENSKTITTNANNTTFGVYYGGGNGGTSYVQYDKTDVTGDYGVSTGSYDWNGTGNNQGHLNSYNAGAYRSGGHNYMADYDTEIVNVSTGTETGQAVCRTYFYAAQFSATNTGPITNNLTNCTVLTNFYGGGNLGGVKGTVTSTLTETHVHGSAFGAGFSASIPEVTIHNRDKVSASIDINTGIITPQSGGTSTTYTWTNETSLGGQTLSTSRPAVLNVDGKNYYYTEVSLVNLGTVSGNVTLNIDGTTVVDGDVYGGGESSNATGNSTVNIIGGTVNMDVYGGGALANVDGYTKVNLIGGTVRGDVYGGGKGRLEVIGKAAVGTEGEEGYEPAVEAVAPIAATVGSATVNLNGIDATDYLAAYTTLTREGDSGPYTVADDKKGCVVGGDIFGCNNLNGTPLGDVTVHVYATQNAAATRITNTTEDETAKVFGRYDVQHVYGGGNLAAYEPTSNTHTTVIIDGCDRTSIYQVYGGGNAASTPATEVNINGTFEIEEAFGGGNGKDAITINGVTKPNPGANVGFKDYSSVESTYPTKDSRQTEEFISAYTYGTGEAKMNIHGGKVHRVYGGSNTKGNVRISAVTMLEEESDCPFDVDEAYGGGKSAPMDGASNLIMACIPGLKAAYGGAEDANIEGDVSLNITNGYFDRVFGGNNVSGSIKGTITVNIEETGCKPIIIGQLYGGGNLAPYSAPSGQHGPTLNVRSFTSIGEVYGGGYGSTAKVTGDTYVNINVCDGMDYSDDESLVSTVADEIANRATITFTDYEIEDGHLKLDDDGNRIPVEKTVSLNMPTRTGLVGAINKVFGGGNAADVTGSTHVNIGTKTNEVFATPATKTVNGTAVATTDDERTNPVRGANITGDVYGGGNAAEVTGDTNVVIGKSN